VKHHEPSNFHTNYFRPNIANGIQGACSTGRMKT
jgi:hypothetical protein